MTTIEDRVRATLVAEAERHPVATDVEDLRARADRAVVDLRLSPRRNRTRVLAAAAVALVALGAGLALAARTGPDEHREPVVVDTAPTPETWPTPAVATGWYLPEGWEITSADPVPMPARPGLVRDVLFMTPDVDVPQATAEVRRTTDPALPAAVVPGGGTPVRRGTGADEREVRVGVAGTAVHVAVARDDLVLHIAGHEMSEAEVLALADTWWESGGRSLPTPAGQVRMWDDSRPDAPPTTADEVVASWGPAGGTAGTAVGVSVRDADGRQAYYELRPPEPAQLPTGVGGADDAAAHGLAPDEVPESIATPDAGEAWSPGEGTIVGHLPGAGLMISASGDDEVARELLASLRSVSAETWRDALTAAGVGVDDTLGAPTLAGTADPTAPPPDDAARREQVLVDRVEEALLGVARAEDPVVLDDRFAESVTIGFMGDTRADVVLGRDDLLRRDAWVLDPDGRWGRSGPVSALDLLAGTDGRLSGGVLASSTLTCSGTERPVDPGYRAVSLVPQATGCDTWFSVVAHLDDQDRITAVRVVLDGER